MPTTAWVIKNKAGELLIPTVGPSERSAMVNWLWVYAGQQVLKTWSDERISRAFAVGAAEAGATLVKVTISEVEA